MGAGESAYEKARRQREKAERLNRSADLWEKGARGEQLTAAALSWLGSEWIVLHDVRWPGRRFANIDHVAIGPGGIFVVDAKNWSGSITLRDGVLRQNSYKREKEVAGCADSAIAVGELVPDFFSYVTPVLCFVGTANLEGQARDVVLSTTANVADSLRARPVVMSAGDVQDAARQLRAAMTPAVGRMSSPPPEDRRFRTLPRQSATRPPILTGRQKTGVALGCLMVPVTLAAVVLITVMVGSLLHTIAKRPLGSQPAGSSPPIARNPSAGVITYKVSATGIQSARVIAWTQGRNGSTHVNGHALPWSIDLPKSEFQYPVYGVNAQNTGEGTITCEIDVDGRPYLQHSATGANVPVVC